MNSLTHAVNAAEKSHIRILIRANDTDVVVLAISLFAEIKAGKLWVRFVVGKKTSRYIDIHDICQIMVHLWAVSKAAV